MTDAPPISPAAQGSLWAALMAAVSDKRLSGTAALAAGLADAPEAVRAEFEGVAVSIDTPSDRLPRPKPAAVCIADRTPEALAILKGWEPFVYIMDDRVHGGFMLETKRADGVRISATIAIAGERSVSWYVVCRYGEINIRGRSGSVSKAYRAAMAALRTVVPEVTG